MKIVAPRDCEKCEKKDVLFYGFDDPKDKTKMMLECSKCHHKIKEKKG